MKTILLTGATGFLGSHLLRFWCAKGHKLLVLKRSSSSLERIQDCAGSCQFYDVDRPNWEIVFEAHKIDTIVHVAASYGRNGESISQILASNTLFPIRLLELAIKNGVSNFINTASSLPRDINAYSLSKAHFQDWLIFKKQEIHSLNLVLEYFYGPKDAEWKFISMVVQKLMNNEPSIDFTQGLQRRDFIYIADVVSAFDVVLNEVQNLESGTSIPVGSGNAHSLRSVVELCQKTLNNTTTTLNFGAIPDRKGEVDVLVADNSILEGLGWQRKYPLQKGLKEFAEST